MTREEAIQRMKEAFESAPNEYEKSVQDGLQLLARLDSEPDPEMCKKIARLEEENKRLLDYTVCRLPEQAETEDKA